VKRSASFLLGALVLGASGIGAQTARDTLHARAQKVPTDSVTYSLVRYCALSSQLTYMRPGCRNYAKLATNEVALTQTTFPFPPACIRGDTTTSPVYTVVGKCQPEPIDTTSRRYVSSTLTSLGTSPAVLVASPPIEWTAIIFGARWIWKASQVANPSVADTAAFYQQFSTNGLKAVALDIAADNGYAVWLNGQLLVDSLNVVNQTTYQRSARFTLPPTAIVIGTNTLLMVVRNAGDPSATSPAQNPAGLLYALTIGTP